MDDKLFSFVDYHESSRNEWEELVENNSANGTFLNSRRFIDYHPKTRFKECSLLVYNAKNKLVAVCPATEYVKDGSRIFDSYQGATFGGPIIARKFYSAKYVVPLIKELTDYLKDAGYDEVYFRPTSEIFSLSDTALLEYAFFFNGYYEYKQLCAYIDYERYQDDVMANLSDMKRRNVRKCEKEKLSFKKMEAESEIEEYYDILCENLQKFNVKPVHSLEELYDFKFNRLKQEIEFFGVFDNFRMLAGTMVFLFDRVGVAHTQYLAERQDSLMLSPLTYVYYKLICEMQTRGYEKLSWGSATEDMGRFLNQGLITNKESFGSRHSNNMIYHMKF